jgi:hypothetical protein
MVVRTFLGVLMMTHEQTQIAGSVALLGQHLQSLNSVVNATKYRIEVVEE